jgi:hypothetical protein
MHIIVKRNVLVNIMPVLVLGGGSVLDQEVFVWK